MPYPLVASSPPTVAHLCAATYHRREIKSSLTLLSVIHVTVHDARQFAACQLNALVASLVRHADIRPGLSVVQHRPEQGCDFLRMPPLRLARVGTMQIAMLALRPEGEHKPLHGAPQFPATRTLLPKAESLDGGVI